MITTKSLKAAAARGDTDALFRLGYRFAFGRKRPRPTKWRYVVGLWRKAARAGRKGDDMVRFRYLMCGCAALTLVTAPARAEESTTYMAAFLDGKKVGYCRETRRVAEGKVTTTAEMVCAITREGATTALLEKGIITETADGKPLGFSIVQGTGPAAQTIRGTIGADGKLNVTVEAGGRSKRSTMDWPEGALMEEGFRLLEKKKGLKEGTTYTVKVFLAQALRAVPAVVRIGPAKEVDLLGRVVHLTEVKVTFKHPTGDSLWTRYVDDDLEEHKLVSSVLGGKFELIACHRSFALSKHGAKDFFEGAILASPVPLAKASSAKAVTYHLALKPGAVVVIVGTDGQTVRPGDEAIVLTVRPVRPPARASFPYKGADRAAREALKPTAFLESTDPKIVAAARKAVGEAGDAAEAVRRIEAFVREHLRKSDLSVGYATAREALESKQGDCTEHAVLAAAMCRAVGIPARIVSGLVYIGPHGGKPSAFAPHAWAKALVGDKWVYLDPARAGGYGAGHIALSAGDGRPDGFFRVVASLADMRIAKVEVQK
jgi:hypothetical protein